MSFIRYLISVLLILSLSSCKLTKKSDEDEKAKELESLTTLPYASIVMANDGERGGVLQNVSEKTYKGYTLFCLRNKSFACLYDMDGNCVKRWEYKGDQNLNWQYVDFDDEGNLYFLEKAVDLASHRTPSTLPVLSALGKFDRSGKLLWHKRGRFHHDFIVIPDNKIVTFSRKERLINRQGEEIPILDDKIVILDSTTGDQIREYSVYDLLGDEYITARQIAGIKRRPDFSRIVQQIKKGTERKLIINDTPGDVFHINSIRRIDRQIPDFSEVGDYLISIREPNLVAVLKSDFSGLRWKVKDVFKKQHQPSLLDNDHILVFDNRWKKGFSRVAEMDVRNKEIVWQYNAEQPGAFFSATRGGAQKLPNGNVLAIDSNQGQIIEVTEGGEIVWRYLSPSFKTRNRIVRPAIYRAKRFGFEELKKRDIL